MLQCRIQDFRSPEHAPVDEEAIHDLLCGKQTQAQFETVHLDADGKPHFLSFSAKTHLDESGKVIQVSGTARDITEQKAFQHQLSYHAEHDSLTGLFNRNYFQQELERTVARVARSGTACALFYIDLDQFKYINDTLGHAAGDRLLVDVATLLSSHVRDGDLLARFGGDEFTLLLYNIDKRDVMTVAENFRALCDDYKFVEDDTTCNIACSIALTRRPRVHHGQEAGPQPRQAVQPGRQRQGRHGGRHGLGGPRARDARTRPLQAGLPADRFDRGQPRHGLRGAGAHGL
jgi:diguanylate cyclase (GGDEF)-like protein